MSSPKMEEEKVDASADDRPPSPVITPREEKRKTRMATEGTAFLLAQLRAQAQPQPTPSNVPVLPDPSGQSVPVVSTQQNAPLSSAPPHQSQLIHSSLHDDDDSSSKKPRLEETVVLVETTATVLKERPVIDYDFTKEASLICTEADSFADSTLDFKFSSKIRCNNYLKGCKWSPNGELLLTSAEDRKTRTFRLHENDQQLDLVSGVPQGDLIYDFCWHPDEGAMKYVTTTRDHPIHVWDAQTGERQATFRGINHLDELSSAQSLRFSLDGRKLYAGYNKQIRLFDFNRPGSTCQTIPTYVKGLDGQKSIVSCMAMNPMMDGVYAVACYGPSIGLYSDRTMALDCLFGGHSGGITHMLFSNDGNFLFTGGRKDCDITCWDLRFPGQALCRFQRTVDTNQRIYFDIDAYDCLAFIDERCRVFSQNRYLVSGSSDGVFSVWDLSHIWTNSGEYVEPILQQRAHKSAVNGVSLHPTRAVMATSSGQRVFPIPMSDEDDSDDSEGYVRSDCPSKLDNSIKLWSFASSKLL